ncbi:TolC family protein [Candidatus Sumerlaeota bacterium]|nr:TolC family protein [Candidatus Sumerlaeota bacterium]
MIFMKLWGYLGSKTQVFSAIFLVFLTGSCSKIGDYATERADKAAYGIIEQKQIKALGKAGEFTIDDTPDPATERLLSEAPRLDMAGNAYTTPTYTISLSDALALAVANNRDYKAQRESLYAQALSLTEVRRDYAPLFSGSVSAGVTRTEQGDDVEWFGSRGFSLGVSKLLATGGRITMDFSHSFVRYFTHDPMPGASNSLSAALSQPLLRGAGSLVALEGLRQAERSMIYSVRSFRRFQQSFVINVVSRYYDLLGSQDELRNAQNNYKTAVDNWKKLKKLSEGGKVSNIEVDQGRQKALQAEAGLSRSRRSYGRRLDEFKIFLGVPVDLDFGPDPRELDIVASRGLMKPDMTLKQAIEIAQAERLDMKTSLDQLEDSERGLKIALRNFLPDLNFDYNFSTSTGDDKDRVKLDFENHTNQGNLSLGLPFDWALRRNRYRHAQISLQQNRRSLDEFKEQLILEVRDAWRELEEARIAYRIQLESVRLAERRVEMASLFLQSGRATARDLLEAEDELLASRNALTQALVSHTIQRLGFWNTIERLEIDERGIWEEEAKK